jgi:hypothetical protein
MSGSVKYTPDEVAAQLEAAAELLRDGHPDPAQALMDTFPPMSQATSYRRLAQVQSDQQAEASTGRQTVDLAELALAEYWSLVKASTDQEQRLAALTAMTNAMSKLKIRTLPESLL